MVKKWAKEQHRGQVNAQKCPKCKVSVKKLTLEGVGISL